MSFRLPLMEPCYFCAIIEGAIEQWNIVEKNSLTITMLNGRQFEVGQCVIIPVRHAPTLLDLTEHELAAVMIAAKKLTQVMVKAFAPEGVLLYQNNGVGSGQEVPHFHLHVVPRRSESDWGFGPPHIARLEQKKALSNLITPQSLTGNGRLLSNYETITDEYVYYRQPCLNHITKRLSTFRVVA